MNIFLNNKNKSHFFKWLLFLIISFFSWNYFGIIFVINVIILLKFIEKTKKLPFYKYISSSLIYTFLWHLGAIGWLIGSDKGFYGLILSAFVYVIPFIIYYLISIYYFKIYVFIIVFLLFEILLNTLSSSNPMLTIGNVLGNQIYLSQWYSYTTVLGGSIWLMFLSYSIHQFYTYKKRNVFLILILAFIPVITSTYLYYSKDNLSFNGKINYADIIIFNPEHYNGKKDNANISLHLYNKLKNTNASFLILPEGLLKFDSSNFKNTFTFKILKKIIKESSIENIFFGAEILVNKNEKLNIAILLNENEVLVKVKEKLVPFTEYIPKRLRPFYKKKTFVTNYQDETEEIISKYFFQPLICYDGFYPFFSSTKANLIILISSEWFMKDSFYGKRQYLNFMRLRSIENRKPLIKSSSYGYSCIISKKGEILEFAENKELYKFKNSDNIKLTTN